MAPFYLDEKNDHFPPINPSDDELIALGGHLDTQTLLRAYRCGIFPWFSSDEQPIQWYSFNPRLILYPDHLYISSSMAKMLRQNRYRVRLDYNFKALIRCCAGQSRRGQKGTWITERMIEAYTSLHNEGYAHSCEVYNEEGVLAGGFYGVMVDHIFCGESMVSLEKNISKYALIKFISYFKGKGLAFIDCQQPTEHMISMGSTVVSREFFLKELSTNRDTEHWRGNWQQLFSDFSS